MLYVVRRLVPGSLATCARAGFGPSSPRRQAAHRLRLDEAPVLASVTLLVSAGAVAYAWWLFAPLLFTLFSHVSTAAARDLELLSPAFVGLSQPLSPGVQRCGHLHGGDLVSGDETRAERPIAPLGLVGRGRRRDLRRRIAAPFPVSAAVFQQAVRGRQLERLLLLLSGRTQRRIFCCSVRISVLRDIARSRTTTRFPGWYSRKPVQPLPTRRYEGCKVNDSRDTLSALVGGSRCVASVRSSV